MELLKVNYQSEEPYENLLLESSSVSVHQRHLRFIVTEIYKSTTPIKFEFMRPYFTFNNISFNLSKEPILYLPSTHSTYYGTNSVQEDPWFGTNFLGILNVANHYLNLKPKLRTLEILIADCGCVRLTYTLNLHCILWKKYHYENNYFSFHDKTYSKGYVSCMFHFYHRVCSNNYFEYNTFYNSFIVWLCWNLLALAIIYTNSR